MTATPKLTFADVFTAVNAAPDLTPRVRSNLRNAVGRCAAIQGMQGLSRVVDVQSIAKSFDGLTAAKLGFANEQSLPAFKSNLRRALHLAGVQVMPGRSVTPLSSEFAELKNALEAVDPFLWTRLSRFIHYVCGLELSPVQVNEGIFDRFSCNLRETCINSKVDKTLRNTARAWITAQAAVPAWPAGDLGHKRRKSDTPLLPWAAYPPTLEQDARAFVTRQDVDWMDEEARQALRPSTQRNYLDGLRRSAGILVAHGECPDGLRTLADIATLTNAKTIIQHVHRSTGRKTGGHTEFLALLMHMAARDHVRGDDDECKKLKQLWRKTRAAKGTMSDKTLQRYLQFEDPAVMDALLRLPARLIKLADEAPRPDIRSAKLARVALFLTLLFDTAARQGNIVSLDLNRHVISEDLRGKGSTFIVVADSEVKNDEEVRTKLTSVAVSMLRHYMDVYRPIHCDLPSAWLFPRKDGTHWSTTQAWSDLRDLVARYIGVDVTPHLVRTLVGKLILEEHPGAVALVQQLLGHKRLQTTMSFYVRIDKLKAREDYQSILSERRRS